MRKKTYSKTGSLTRGEARKAVLGVKKARSAAKKVSGAKKKASSWYVKRYLGHFGFALAAEVPENGYGDKRSPSKKKTTAKKASSAAKKYRRAS